MKTTSASKIRWRRNALVGAFLAIVVITALLSLFAGGPQRRNYQDQFQRDFADPFPNAARQITEFNPGGTSQSGPASPASASDGLGFENGGNLHDASFGGAKVSEIAPGRPGTTNANGLDQAKDLTMVPEPGAGTLVLVGGLGLLLLRRRNGGALA